MQEFDSPAANTEGADAAWFYRTRMISMPEQKKNLIWSARLSRVALGRLSLDERRLLFGAGQAYNELVLDQRFLMLSIPSEWGDWEPERHGQHMQCFYLVRQLAARCREVHRMLEKNYTGPQISQTLHRQLTRQAQSAWREATCKSNRTFLDRIRGSFAFHMDSLGARTAALEHVPAEALVFYATEPAGLGTFYRAADLVLQFSVLVDWDGVEAEPDERMRRLAEAVTELPPRVAAIAGHWTVFLDALIGALLRRVEGAVEERRSEEMASCPQADDLVLPWFMNPRQKPEE